MIANSHNNSLFNESGCLSRKALMQYLTSALEEEELKLVEAHISSCDLCKDAVAGMQLFDESELVMEEVAEEEMAFPATYDQGADTAYKSPATYDHTERLNMKLRQRFGYFPGRKRVASRGPHLRNFIVPAAASIIILVSIISYFHFLVPETNELALADEKELLVEEPGQKATIGGIPKRESDNKGYPAATQTEKKDDHPADQPVEDKKEEIVALEEQPITVEEDIMLTELDEAVEEVEPVVVEETITANAMEEVAGTGVAIEEDMGVSRAKSGKRATGETKEMIVVHDSEPMFPGGKDSLRSYFTKSIHYPLAFNGQGDTSVVVSFTVNKRGKIKNVNITRGAGDDYNNAVLEAVRNMPDWIPAIKEGKNVDEKVILPIFLNFGE